MTIVCDMCGEHYNEVEDTTLERKVRRLVGEQNEYHVCPTCGNVLQVIIEKGVVKNETN